MKFILMQKEEIRRLVETLKKIGLFVEIYIDVLKMSFCFLEQNENRRHGINQWCFIYY